MRIDNFYPFALIRMKRNGINENMEKKCEFNVDNFIKLISKIKINLIIWKSCWM